MRSERAGHVWGYRDKHGMRMHRGERLERLELTVEGKKPQRVSGVTGCELF